MKNLAFGVLLVGLLVACGGEDKKVMVVTPDATMQCNPLLNTGCPANQKCTWLLDALTPNYVGHIGCAPEGSKQVGETCMYGPAGPSGYDDCVHGSVCSNFRGTGPGVCKAVCDQQGGMPACDSAHVCVVYANLFDLGETTPAAAGVCNVACNPLTANDYDGSASTFTRPDNLCGSAAEGCYGSPSYGTPPISGWSCTRDIHYFSECSNNVDDDGDMAIDMQDSGCASPSDNSENQVGDQPDTFYAHRTQCTVANGCADPVTTRPYQNSCNQGYLPLLYEETGSTTVICVAFCEPENCFTGNCGTANANRQGKTRTSGPSHRCKAEDRQGLFDEVNGTSTGGTNNGGGEHCQFLWRREIDSATATYLPSPTSDTLGFCYDHGKYQYDSDADNMPDKVLPNCGELQDGFGSGEDPAMPLTYFGAADLGCVDSTRLMASGKPGVLPEQAKAKLNKVDIPRPLYDRSFYE